MRPGVICVISIFYGHQVAVAFSRCNTSSFSFLLLISPCLCCCCCCLFVPFPLRAVSCLVVHAISHFVDGGISLSLYETHSTRIFLISVKYVEGDTSGSHPLIDYTPPSYITLLFTDLGVLTPSAVSDELIKLYL